MKKQAITLLEIIISVTIISMLMILLFSVIAKKAKAVAETTSGTFHCYKDSKGSLNQLVELSDGTKQEMHGIDSCNFSFPNEATSFTVYVIGGGGGGGKIEENSGYVLSDLVTHEISFLKPTVDACAQWPMIKEMGAISEVQSFPYLCADNVYYDCQQGFKNVRAENTDTKLIKMFSNASYEKIALKDRSLFVKGGANLNNELGAYCTFKVNLEYGENIEEFFDGTNEYECETGMMPKNISASSGKFTTSSLKITAQGRTFVNETINNKNIHQDPHCNSEGAGNPIKRTNRLNRQNDKLEYITITPVIQYGTGGSAGTYITNASLKFSGRNIIIPKKNIGNGGKAGENGQPTTFEEYNIKAQGGAAGVINTTTFETSIDNFDDGFKILDDDLVSTGYGQYTLNENRKKTKVHENINNDGEISRYVYDKIIPGIVADKQDEYKGIGAKCNATSCTEATSPNRESFGSGGGGGSSRLIYEPYYKLSYKKPNYENGEYDSVIDVINTPKLEYKDGSAGMGGAIVIVWK